MVVALVAAAVVGMSILLTSSPSTDVSPSPVPARTSYTEHPTIYINGDAQFNNTLYPSNGVVSGNGTVSNPYVIAGWDINASAAFGITIWGTSAYFVIRDCYVHSGWLGGTGNYGIYVANCVNGVVRNNTVVDCNCGISLQSSSDCTVSDNTCNYNENLGLYVMYLCHDNIISNNTCGFNNYYGMSIQESNDNIVSDNNCSNNNVLGMYLTYWSSGNVVSNNTCVSNNPFGIIIQQSSGNTLTDNNCSDNGYGVYITQSSSYNNISSCEVSDNTVWGIYLESGSYNRIWNNVFAGNGGGGVQAYDSGTSNWWNSSGSPHGYGNWWSDLTAPDYDLDGIVDWSYNLTGSAGAKDYYPLTTPPVPIPEFGAAPVVAMVLMAAIVLTVRARRRPPVA